MNLSGKRKLTILIITYLAYVSIYISRLNLTQAAPIFKATDFINEAQIGLLGSVFTGIYAFGRLINGGLSDRISPFIMIGAGLALSAIGNLCIGFLSPFGVMLVLWGINAYAQSMLWNSVIKTLSLMYDTEIAKKKASVMVTSVATGTILGIILNTALINSFGVAFAFLIPGAITLLLAVCIVVSNKQLVCETNTEKKQVSFFALFKDKRIRTVTLPAFFHGAIKDNISLWMTVYFVAKFEIDLNKSSLFVLFIPSVGLLGRLVYMPFFRLCKENEHRVSVLSFILCAVLSLVMCVANHPLVAAIALGLIYAVISLINTSMLSIFPIAFSAVGKQGSVSGLMDFITYGGASVASLVYGFSIEHLGYNSMYISWIVICIFSTAILYKFATKKDA